jgi:PhnB protein
MANAKKTKKPTKNVAKRVKKAVRKPAKKVSFIPKDYHSITPYLIVNKAKEAIDFYTKAFGAKVKMQMEKPEGKIGHAELKMGDAHIMLADEHPEMGARSPFSIGGSPVGIHLYIKNVDAVVERAVSLGSKIVRPVTDMFYGDRSGTIEDPFGHTWHISTHIEDVTPAQVKKRAAESVKYKK